VEKVLLLVVFAAGCALCSSSLARDRVGSGSGIGSRNGGTHFGAGSLMPKRQPEPRKEPSAATGGSAEKPEAPKDDKKSEVKKITITK
jgi:hypothetical protein